MLTMPVTFCMVGHFENHFIGYDGIPSTNIFNGDSVSVVLKEVVLLILFGTVDMKLLYSVFYSVLSAKLLKVSANAFAFESCTG